MAMISHKSIFDKLSLDLWLGSAELKNMLYEMDVPAFIDYLRARNISLFTIPHTLHGDLCDMNGKVLISNGQNVVDRLKMLLERYMNDKNFHTMPLCFMPDEKLVSHYRFQMKSIIMQEIQSALVKHPKLSFLYKQQMSRQDSTFDQLAEFIDHVTDTPRGINICLNYIVNLKANHHLFTKTAASSFLSLLFGKPYFAKVRPAEKDQYINKLMCACFFQSSHELSDEKQDASQQEKALNSASITNDVCDCPRTTDAVAKLREHHKGRIKPLFKEKENAENDFLKIMSSVNLFLGVMESNNFMPANIEAHKSMYYLAESGYASRDIVDIQGQVLLPNIKARILSYANAIKEKATCSPVIWGLSGDMIPIKVICDREDCAHIGQHKTLIPERVKVKADYVYDTDIYSGIYYTCNLLTNKLRDYYKSQIKAPTA
ncbi:MAG: hypothetical protein AB7E76_11420 [Deferribacterales bacterium]|jgi:hypothetical protein